jgi:hypothetical protein
MYRYIKKTWSFLVYFVIPLTRYSERVSLEELWRDLVVVVSYTHGTHFQEFMYPWRTFSRISVPWRTFLICQPSRQQLRLGRRRVEGVAMLRVQLALQPKHGLAQRRCIACFNHLPIAATIATLAVGASWGGWRCNATHPCRLPSLLHTLLLKR